MKTEKVYAYITCGGQLLVFEHTHFPEAGIQVPGGKVEEGESLETAVLREAIEETGLQELTIHGKKPENPAACGGGKWTSEPIIWLHQTAVGFFLGISPGRIVGTSSRNKIEELSH